MLRFFVFLLWVSPCVLTKATGRCQGEDCDLNSWLNTSCKTDDDCNQRHAVCYQHLCRCDPGYFYTTNNTCTSTCRPDDLQNNFTQYPDSVLRENNLTRWDGLSLEVCKDWCQTDKTCLTFDFKARGGLCWLHNVTARQSPSKWSPKRSKGWTHYQKSCNSTLASHHTWHNLLCQSNMDCANPKNDYLSVRCLNNLGFEFNDAMKECVVPSDDDVLSKWYSRSCSTDDDCDAPHAECYKRVCRCEPGYFYTTQDTCTGTCSTGELHNNFTQYPDSVLRENLIHSEDGLSLEVCKDRCQTDKRCLTFDFKARGGLCRLHAVTARGSPSNWSPKTSKGWTHYQRSCNSTLATHHTWYNLLCQSRINCPDTNSDCLSGRCLCRSDFKFHKAEKKCVVPRSCVDWQATGAIESGIYTIQLPNTYGRRSVWCDMDTAGGGWLVFQRRRDGLIYNYVDFQRNWTEYENGFGDIDGDFWLGLSWLYILTESETWRLRVDIKSYTEGHRWAEYSSFNVYGLEYEYLLWVYDYSGDAGDGMGPSNTTGFQTYDQNWDGCVTSSKGGWWYPSNCGSTNLNSAELSLFTWGDIGPLMFSEMKIKPRR